MTPVGKLGGRGGSAALRAPHAFPTPRQEPQQHPGEDWGQQQRARKGSGLGAFCCTLFLGDEGSSAAGDAWLQQLIEIADQQQAKCGVPDGAGLPQCSAVWASGAHAGTAPCGCPLGAARLGVALHAPGSCIKMCVWTT